MITVEQWLKIVNYKITEGSNWYSNIPDLFSLNYWDGCADGASSNIVFDPKTQEVYLIEVCDYLNNRAYRIFNKKLEVDEMAWDDVNYIDLEDDSDFIDKFKAIISGLDYDTKVSIPLEFTDSELLKFMKLAHEKNITFNAFIEQAVLEIIKNNKQFESLLDDKK